MSLCLTEAPSLSQRAKGNKRLIVISVGTYTCHLLYMGGFAGKKFSKKVNFGHIFSSIDQYG